MLTPHCKRPGEALNNRLLINWIQLIGGEPAMVAAMFFPLKLEGREGGKRRNEEGGAYVPATSLDPFERLELQHTSSWD